MFVNTVLTLLFLPLNFLQGTDQPDHAGPVQQRSQDSPALHCSGLQTPHEVVSQEQSDIRD